MFDEQDTLDPSCHIELNAQTVQPTLDHDAHGSIDETDKSGYFDFTVDLFAPYMVQYVYAYFEEANSNLVIENIRLGESGCIYTVFVKDFSLTTQGYYCQINASIVGVIT